PLLIASDLERGAGQQFDGATQLPPLAALGALGDLDATRAAANLTAREALALGVNWVFAPVADVDFEPRNPIVGTRAFGSDPERVAAHVVEWIRGCHDAGALCCAKHFPGHGRTVEDSHAQLPSVDAEQQTLDLDLIPFRGAVDARVDAIMTAHVSYPSLDPTGAPATLSAPVLTGLLRKAMGFGGLIVTDALIMEGVLHAGMDEPAAAIRATAAGCDALLYPRDLDGVAKALESAPRELLSDVRVMEAIGRIDATAARGLPDNVDGAWGNSDDAAWVSELAVRTLVVVRGEPRCARSTDVLTVDDDVGGPYPPPTRDRFLGALRDAGIDVREITEADGERDTLVAVYCDIRGWKGRPGLAAESKRA
ncbi:MAG: glycoside hydrolase family 3 N-terminal domain-containing protein, partial [Longimicrobiales bacterium]